MARIAARPGCHRTATLATATAPSTTVASGPASAHVSTPTTRATGPGGCARTASSAGETPRAGRSARCASAVFAPRAGPAMAHASPCPALGARYELLQHVPRHRNRQPDARMRTSGGSTCEECAMCHYNSRRFGLRPRVPQHRKLHGNNSRAGVCDDDEYRYWAAARNAEKPRKTREVTTASAALGLRARASASTATLATGVWTAARPAYTQAVALVVVQAVALAAAGLALAGALLPVEARGAGSAGRSSLVSSPLRHAQDPFPCGPSQQQP